MSELQLDLAENKRILKQRAEILAKPIESKKLTKDLLEIIPFKLDKESFAIETKHIKEIYPLKNHTFLPGAPPFVYGLTNVRRKVIPIIDLKVFFSLNDSAEVKHNLLIIEDKNTELSILIDAFSGIRTLSKTELQPSLPTLTGIRQHFLKGLMRDGTVILDGEKMLTSPHLSINISND